VSFYMVSALVMVFVNKAVLNSTPDLPFSFLFIQLSIAVILLHLTSFLVHHTSVGRLVPVGSKIELPTLDWTTAVRLAPLITIAITGLIFNTLCLRNVDASFFQIARGLQLPLTIIVSSIQAKSMPPRKVIYASSLVALGFFLGVSPSSYFTTYSANSVKEATLISLIYGFLSSLMIAIHAVLVKPAHRYVDGSVVKLAYWTNFVSSCALIPCILVTGELTPLMERYQSGSAEWHVFLVGSVVTGVFGFLLCMAGLLSITNTSATAHMFSSAARSVLQTMLGAAIFGDIITSNRGMSISIITLGALYFTYIKSQKPPPPSSAPAPTALDAKGVPLRKSSVEQEKDLERGA